MTHTDQGLDEVAEAVARLVPQLSERLERHGLGEIEVVAGDLRLRVTGRPEPPTPAEPPSRSTVAAAQAAAPASPTTHGVSSPAVGFFMYADGLGPGMEVDKGTALGHVEVLGVRHDVRAPRKGRVRNLVAETGEPVEYGQVVVELEAPQATGR